MHAQCGLNDNIRGHKSPILLRKSVMISVNDIENILEGRLEQQGIFLVDVLISNGNKIKVFIDSRKGVTIDECVGVSRLIEGNLDRETEDFELEVSSPGLDMPLKIMPQYQKNIGRDVKINFKDGNIQEGRMLDVNETGIIVEIKKKIRLENKKKKQTIIERNSIPFQNIKSVFVLVKFK